MLRRAVLMMATAGSITGAWATVNSGMVILGHDAPAGQLSASTIEVKYLSTGKTIVIENGAACNPVFSPDGRKIAFFHRTLTANLKWTKHYLYTVNVDGSDRKKITTYGDNSRAPEWCTDGYIYFCTRFEGAWRISRVPETGGDYEVVHTYGASVPSPEGGLARVDFGQGSWHCSQDGLRAVSTGQHYDTAGNQAGWAQYAVQVDTHEEFTPWRPCQGSISADGQKLSVSDAGHRIFRIAAWPIPYETYGPDGSWGDSYGGCYGASSDSPYDESGICPGYDTVLHIGPDLNRMFDIGPNWGDNPEIGGPQGGPSFSNSDNDIFMFRTSKPRNELSGGAWLIELSAAEYTKVAPIDTDIYDYYRAEQTLSTPFALAPGYTIFYVDTTGALPGTKTVTLSSAQDMPSAPTLSAVPDWLHVEVTRVNAREYTLACTMISSPMPDTGKYLDTMYVTPGGSSEPLQMLVTLFVDEHPQLPITISNPRAGQVYRIGDTLRVEYSADSTVISGTLISLSVDAGDTWIQMHDDASWETGNNKVLRYVIPSTADGRSLVSAQCLVMVSNYPEGNETFSGVFTITDATGTSRGNQRTGSAHHDVRVAAHRSASAVVLNVTSPSEGIAHLIDLRGRTVGSFRLAKGVQGLTLPSLQGGRYLLEISHAGGERRTVVVDAF